MVGFQKQSNLCFSWDERVINFLCRLLGPLLGSFFHVADPVALDTSDERLAKVSSSVHSKRVPLALAEPQGACASRRQFGSRAEFASWMLLTAALGKCSSSSSQQISLGATTSRWYCTCWTRLEIRASSTRVATCCWAFPTAAKTGGPTARISCHRLAPPVAIHGRSGATTSLSQAKAWVEGTAGRIPLVYFQVIGHEGEFLPCKSAIDYISSW